MYIDKALVGLRVKVDEQSVARYLPCSPHRVGVELAESVEAYARKHALGYYPALEFFRNKAEIDKDLLDTADQIAWLVSKLVREEIQRKLRPIFASVAFQTIQTQAFAMPPVRPNQDHALEQLAQFYTPDTIKLELVLSMLRRDEDTAERKVESYARKMVYRWLRDAFEEVEVTSSAEL